MGEEDGFAGYFSSVITPIFEARVEDGELAVWLNHQLEAWEIEANRPGGLSYADQVVECLRRLLDELRERIREKIAAAEAVLEGWAA